jgi:4-alpha-glucanotransferase
MPTCAACPRRTRRRLNVLSGRKKLNALPQIDYEAALRLKLERLQHAFAQEGKRVLASPEFRRFYLENEHWLPPNAMFCVPAGPLPNGRFFRVAADSFFSRGEMANFCAPYSPDYDEVCFWYYVQYILHAQLLAAVKRAREKGII